MADTIPWMVAVAIAGSSMAAAWWANRATGAKDLTEAAVQLLKPYRDEVNDLKVKVAILEQHVESNEQLIQRLQRWAAILVNQVVELNGDPVRFDEVR